jgi:shikimate kinase
VKAPRVAFGFVGKVGYPCYTLPMSSTHTAPALKANLVLIGGRGSGKSSIGRRIARMTKGLSLYSLDELIRYEAYGQTIPEIVAERGWVGFRALERVVVEKASSMPGGLIIDAGGGVVVELDRKGQEVYSETKVAALRRYGRVVYLRRDARYLLERIEGDPDRPALSSRDSFLEIMARRDPWYARASHHIVECGDRSKRDIAEAVLGWFERQTGALRRR